MKKYRGEWKRRMCYQTVNLDAGIGTSPKHIRFTSIDNASHDSG